MSDTFTFPLEPDLRAALASAAERRRQDPGQLVRELVRGYVERETRTADAARRSCEAINAAAGDPASDEAAVMAELDALFEEDPFGAEWKP